MKIYLVSTLGEHQMYKINQYKTLISVNFKMVKQKEPLK